MNALREIAHDSLSLREPAFLKHYRRAAFKEWNGIAFWTSELPGPGFNFASVLRPDVPKLDELLPVAREWFAHCEQGWGVLVEGDAGHPMEAELIARGWVIAEDEPAFVMEQLTAGINPAARQELAIKPIRTEADMRTFAHVACAAFGSPIEFAEMMMPSLAFATDPQMCWAIGEYEGEAVTVSGYSRSGDTAVVSCVATLESHRGRGFGAAMTHHILAHAAEGGCTSASLRSGPKSIPLYERLGFKYVCQHRTYSEPS